MGVWDAAIFDDDLAWDVMYEYRGLLEQRVPDAEATRRVVEGYGPRSGDDEEATLWLALAASQHIVGRLDEEVKSEALRIIDTGVGMELWEEVGGADLRRRTAMLARLRDKLTGPQPAPKRVRRPRQTSTDLEPGDILSLTAGNGAVALVRVLRVEHDRDGTRPIIALLDWSGGMPDPDHLEHLAIRSDEGVSRPSPDEDFVRAPSPMVISPLQGRNDSGWSEAGFTRVARVAPKSDDSDAEVIHGLHWSNLCWHLTLWLER